MDQAPSIWHTVGMSGTTSMRSLPDHSSLTRIRQRLGLDLFRRFFEHVVELCDKAGLIWGKELLVDATKVPANAADSSIVPRLREVIDDHLVELFADTSMIQSRKPRLLPDARLLCSIHHHLPVPMTPVRKRQGSNPSGGISSTPVASTLIAPCRRGTNGCPTGRSAALIRMPP